MNEMVSTYWLGFESHHNDAKWVEGPYDDYDKAKSAYEVAVTAGIGEFEVIPPILAESKFEAEKRIGLHND